MMGKKSTTIKKLRPILEEANQLRNDKNYEDAVRKLREAITFIRLNVKEYEEREREVENIMEEIDQTYFAQTDYLLNQIRQSGDGKRFNEAFKAIDEAFLINNKIKKVKLKDDSLKKISHSKNETKLKELIDEAEKLKIEKNFDSAVEIFQKAMKTANEIYAKGTGKEIVSKIQDHINQTYLEKIDSMIKQAKDLKIAKKKEDSIKTYQNAIKVCDNLYNSEQKKTETLKIEGYINEIYSEQIKPLIEAGETLIKANSIQNGVLELKTAEKIVNKMYDSQEKESFLLTLSKLINPYYIEKIKPVKEKALELLKVQDFEEKINVIFDAASTFKKALDTANEMITSDDKKYVVNELKVLLDDMCSGAINIRKNRGTILIEEKKFDEAIGEMYTALSIAKNMACAEIDNKEIEDIKYIVNQIYSKQISEILQKGKSLLDMKKNEEALEIFNEALRISNKMYVSEEMEEEIKKINELMKEAEIKKLVSEGTLMVQQKKFSKELEELQKSLTDADKITNLERKTKKIKEIKEAIDLVHSNEIKFLNEQALSLAEEYNFEEAYKHFESALTIAKTIDKERVRIEETNSIIKLYIKELNNEAERDLGKSQFEQAIINCQHAIDLDPDDALSYYNMGNAYFGKKSFNDSITYYQKAVELNPDDKEAWSDLGLVYDLKNDFSNAFNSLNKAIEIDKNYSPAWYRLGNVYQNQNNLDKAIESYRMATDLNPNNANAWLFMGNVFQHKKDFNTAVECYKKAISSDANLKDEINKLIENFDNALTSLETKLIELYKNKKDKVF